MKNRPPAFRHHKATNQAVVTVRTSDGKRKDVYLGVYGSEKAEAAYAKFLAERRVAAVTDQAVSAVSLAELSVAELMVAFLHHAREYYRRADRTQTNEVGQFLQTMRIVDELYGLTPAKAFDSLALKTVRRAMIDGDPKKGRRPWCRTLVNQRIGRVKRIWKWAAEEKLIPTATYLDLTMVKGLEIGRSLAKETEPVGPVLDEDVDGTLPFLNRHVRGMVEFQRHTGCRPGEVCLLRWADIDRSGPVWYYKPAHHKLVHKGKDRVIPIGLRAQAVLTAFPTDDPENFVFSPRRCVEEVCAARAAGRQTPRFASHMARNAGKRKSNPHRKAGSKYRTPIYGNAVTVAVERANKAGVKVRHWHPNQLRHSFATMVRKLHGLEAVQVCLGHSNANVTQVYAQRDLSLATEVAMKVG